LWFFCMPLMFKLSTAIAWFSLISFVGKREIKASPP
jgi:hypothetical protein